MSEQTADRIVGTVTSGLGRGKDFVTMDGYSEQFRAKFGYEPYPGTLNVALPEEQTNAFDGRDRTVIEEWSDGETTYGAVDCYPATIASNSNEPESCYVIVPRRTDHDASTLEIVAPVKLRSALELADDATVTVNLCED
jgi:riboflavin kinase